MTQQQDSTVETAIEVDTSHIQRKEFDLAYSDISPSQKLDIYWPSEGNGPFPVIVSIHGGAFRFGDKRDLQVKPMLAGLNRGYAVVSINYRMSGEAIFPALVHDVKAAIRWVRANAATYQFDPERIAAWGGSAGGYLALMLGITAKNPEMEDLTLGNPDQSSSIQAVVDWFGPTDFLKMDIQFAQLDIDPAFAHNNADSPESLLLGQQITDVPALVQVANPETYIHSELPPFFIQHGDQDDIVPYKQSVEITAKLSKVLGSDRVSLELLPGIGHGGPGFETDENLNKVFTFLDQALCS